MRATIDSVWLYQNQYGVDVESAEAAIRESVASGGASAGFLAASSSKVMIENSVATNNGYGFYAGSGAVMAMSRCAATSNAPFVGIFSADSGTTIYVSDSTIAANATGIGTFDGGVVSSRGNNTLQANTTNGAFTATFSAN